MLVAVTESRTRLVEMLEAQYRSFGWSVERAEGGLVLATGPGGVTWIGAAVTEDDVASGELEARLPELSQRRMPSGGELCPLELMPEPACEADVRELLDRLGLSDRPHVALYSLAA